MSSVDFRESQGESLIYGKVPVKIVASYKTETGETKQSLLLASGWWGVSRHFHYLPELLAAFSWSVPCLWSGNVLGFSYFIFLFFLLTDRLGPSHAPCGGALLVPCTHEVASSGCSPVLLSVLPRREAFLERIGMSSGGRSSCSSGEAASLADWSACRGGGNADSGATRSSLRDEQRCKTKYGKYWEEYKKLVPYRVVPYIF